MPEEPTYLGDGLYATSDGYQIVLTANLGSSEQATVYLDGGVYAALQRYAKSLGWED